MSSHVRMDAEDLTVLVGRCLCLLLVDRFTSLGIASQINLMLETDSGVWVQQIYNWKIAL